MKHIVEETYKIYSHQEGQEPAVTVDSGDEVVFHAVDAYNNEVVDETILKTTLLDRGYAYNPSNGPVYVRSAMPGDTLKITIEDIEIVGGYGSMCIYAPEFYPLGEYLEREQTVRVPIENGQATFFDGRVKLPIHPMIGEIAVAPAGIAEDTLTPGVYGGNMDCRIINAGTILYLPVFTPGALLSLGDVHALQGDGEMMTAIEAPAQVTVKVEVIKNRQEAWPVLETEDAWYVIASSERLEEAKDLALRGMADFLIKRGGGFTRQEWMIMMGVAGNLEICNVVDTRMSLRMGMSKNVAKDIRF